MKHKDQEARGHELVLRTEKNQEPPPPSGDPHPAAPAPFIIIIILKPGRR
jgi:hypothetical protein